MYKTHMVAVNTVVGQSERTNIPKLQHRVEHGDLCSVQTIFPGKWLLLQLQEHGKNNATCHGWWPPSCK